MPGIVYHCFLYFVLTSSDLNLMVIIATNCLISLYFATKTQQSAVQLHMVVWLEIAPPTSFTQARPKWNTCGILCMCPCNCIYHSGATQLVCFASYQLDPELFPSAFLHSVAMQDLCCDWLKTVAPWGKYIMSHNILLPHGKYLWLINTHSCPRNMQG